MTARMGALFFERSLARLVVTPDRLLNAPFRLRELVLDVGDRLAGAVEHRAHSSVGGAGARARTGTSLNSRRQHLVLRLQPRDLARPPRATLRKHGARRFPAALAAGHRGKDNYDNWEKTGPTARETRHAKPPDLKTQAVAF